MNVSKSEIGRNGCKLLSYLFMWGSGGSFAAGHYAASVVAGFAAAVCFVLTYLLDPN